MTGNHALANPNPVRLDTLSVVAKQLNSPELIKTTSFINGAWFGSSTLHDVRNPSSGDVIAQIPLASKKTVLSTIAAASETFADWKNLLPEERSKYLRKWHDLILANREDLAKIISLE